MPIILLLSTFLPNGTVVVETPHYGATVVIDRQPVGLAPVPPQTVSAGLHWVEVIAAGRPAFRQLIHVEPGQTVTVVVRLPDLPRAPATPTEEAPEPTTSLTGSVAQEGAYDAAAADTALRQAWAIDARHDETLGGRIAGRVFTRFDAPDRLRLADSDDTATRLDEAVVDWRPGPLLRVGRAPRMGPGGRAWLLDGLAVERALGPAQISALGGRHAATIGPNEGLAAGAGVRWADLVQADWLYVDKHHVDLQTAVRWDALSMDASVRSVDTAYAGARARLSWLTDPWQISAGAQHQAVVVGPFELSLPGLVTPRFRTDLSVGRHPRIGLEAGLRGAARWGEQTDESPHGQDLTGTVGWTWRRARLALSASHGQAQGDGALGLITRSSRIEVQGAIRGPGWRLDGSAGAASQTVTPGGDRTVPTVASRAALWLGSGWWLDAAVHVEGAHPALRPDSDVVTHCLLGVSLR